MTRVDTAVRQKRFRVKPGIELALVIETLTGKRFELAVSDASVKGIGAHLKATQTTSSQEEALTAELNGSDLVPESKIVWADFECSLGRLAVTRVMTEADGRVFIAFACVDTKLPLMGSLARCFHELERGIESPLDFELGSGKFSIANFIDTEFPHPDLFERCRQYQFLLKDHRKNPLFQYYSVNQGADGARVKYRLARTGKVVECVSFASYDYLGLADHPEVKEAVKKAIDTYGMSSCGSMILSGKTQLHEELEIELSRTFGKEDCVLFPNGFAANVGTITALLRPSDLVVADIYCHASIHDGISAAKAKSRFYRHNDTASLERVLTEHRESANGCLIITEGLFSMEGTISNMEEIVDLAKKFNCRIFVDECHSFGTIGETGLGAAQKANVLSDVDLLMASFSKGLGIGAVGFVVGDKTTMEWLRYFARAGMFSGAIAPAMAAGALAALKLAKSGDSLLRKLQENSKRFKDGIRRIGMVTPADDNSPIIPVVVGDEARLGAMNEILIKNGIYVNTILFPAVPVGSARLRFSLTTKHSASDIDMALFSLEKAWKETAHLAKAQGKEEILDIKQRRELKAGVK